MIPRFKPTLGLRELGAVLRPARQDAVSAFERGFATLMGQKHAIAFPYGRTALSVLLQAMGLRGREVIVPAYTCVVVAHAIVHSGNEPVFVDSQEPDFNMDLALVEQAITERTGAIIPTSIFGYPVDLDQLDALSSRHPELLIIQDCAHSFSARWRDRSVQQAGDAAIYGLNVSKLITSIFGGMLTTDRDDLAERVRTQAAQVLSRPSRGKGLKRRLYLASFKAAFSRPLFGMTNRLDRMGLLSRLSRYYQDDTIELPDDAMDQMTAAEASVGLLQLERFAQIVERRQALAQYYDEALGELSQLVRPPLIEGATYSHYVVRCERRDEILAHGLHHGIQFGQLIEYSIPQMPAYARRPGARHACPRAALFARTALNLSVSTSGAGAARVARVLRRFFEA